MSVEGRIQRVEAAYEHAVLAGDASGLADAEKDLDAVEAQLALTRGKIMHARSFEARSSGASSAEQEKREAELFRRAAELCQMLGDARGEGEALLSAFFIWCCCLLGAIAGYTYDPDVTADAGPPGPGSGSSDAVSLALTGVTFASLAVGVLGVLLSAGETAPA